jgi:Flp pilus assembly secretin CpaC
MIFAIRVLAADDCRSSAVGGLASWRVAAGAAAVLLAALCPALLTAQTPVPAAPTAQVAPATPNPPTATTASKAKAAKGGAPAPTADKARTAIPGLVAAASAKAGAEPEKKMPSTKARRRAAKLYLEAGKLFLAARYEEALGLYGQAAALDPTNRDYQLAAGVARGHAVTTLVQQAAQARMRLDAVAARVALTRAMALDPRSPIVTQHLNELGDDALAAEPGPLLTPIDPGATDRPLHTPELRSFHLYTDIRQVIQQVFRGYGMEATMDDSVRNERVRFAIDNATFEQTMTALGLVTHTFYVPLDPRRVLVARDSRELRQQYTRLELETIQLGGLSANELTELANVAKNVFGIQTASSNPTNGSLTVRATPGQLDALNQTLDELMAGRSQVLLDVRLIQLAHSNQRTTGVQAPQSFTAFNIYSQEQSIFSANSALIQQIISSGLASASDPLAILGILIASGSVSNSLFANGVATFGNGTTLTGISPGSTSLNLNINSSESRQLDRIQLRMADGDDLGATLRLGSRYPIQTSSFGSMGSTSAIAGLTGAGTSSALSSLLSSLSSAASSMTPQVEYQDLGFTLKSKAGVMRNGRVALNLSIKIDALSGASADGNPILNHRSYEGDVQVEEGAAVVVASELDRTESRAVSGTPGIDEIPGLSATDSRNKQTSGATLLLVVTPHVVRSPTARDRSQVLHIERGTTPAAN